MTEMLAFTRRSGENINALLARYEAVRQRAANEGHFVMSIEGCALQILRAVGVQANQLTNLLHQFGGRLPNNEIEYQTMITQVRRQGHTSKKPHLVILPLFCRGRSDGHDLAPTM